MSQNAPSSPSLPSLAAPDLVLTGRFEPGQEQCYVHVPFDVPAGVQQLHLRYDYTDRIASDPGLKGGNTLDIGLFDERGIAPGSPGFRGWSGSNKLAFTIDREWATPPYRPGPLGAGTWHVLLGPYKIGLRGLDYQVEVWFNPGVAAEARMLRSGELVAVDRVPAAEPGWFRGELHCHTLYSDGDSWPADVRRAAAEAGLDFIAITDHNSIGAHVDAGVFPDDRGAGWPVIIPGVEVTTYRGHWNVWGTKRWYEFRQFDAVNDAIAEAAAEGFVSVSHPKPLGPAWEYPQARGYHAVEVWNGPWQRLNSVALAFWEEHLRRGERVVAVGGSDTHRLQPSPGMLLAPALGRPTNWLRVDADACEAGMPSAEALLQALRRGDGFISASPNGPQVYLTPTTAGVQVRVVGAAGMAMLLQGAGGCLAAHPVTADDWSASVALPAGQRYVRAQIVDHAGTIQALTNPLWL